MKPFIHYISILISLLMIAGIASAETIPTPSSGVKGVFVVTNLETERTDANFYIRFNLDLSRVRMKSEKQLTVTPVLKGEGHCVSLPGAIVAGHNRYLRHLRAKSVPKGYTLFQSGHAKTLLPIDVRLPFEDWMLSASLVLEDTVSGCSCKPLNAAQFDVASVDMEDDKVTNALERVFSPEFVFIEPVIDVEKIREASGHAYIDFPLNKIEIYPEYRRNPIELANIKDTISMIKNDPDYVITSISLKGYASPEGPYDNNEYLAKGRTNALRDYIRTLYNFSPSIMHVSWEAEDWGGLIEWLENSTIANRNALLWVATTSKYDGDYDRREWILKSEYPEQYKWLLANVYPGLRHTDYTVEYSIRSFTSFEEIRAAWLDDPRKMSLNELYILATSYQSGSPEFIEVFETAAALYPHSPDANLNAGVSALQVRDLLRAERYLKKAGESPEAKYAKGILAAEKGDYEEATLLFKRAADAGLQQAKDALSQLTTVN